MRIFNRQSGKEVKEVTPGPTLNDPNEAQAKWEKEAEAKRAALPKGSAFHHIPELDDKKK